MSDLKMVSTSCSNCNGVIEFEEGGEGCKICCPFCISDIVLQPGISSPPNDQEKELAISHVDPMLNLPKLPWPPTYPPTSSKPLKTLTWNIRDEKYEIDRKGIWPNSFTHWKVVSIDKQARLCEVFKLSKSLGLWWKFDLPDSEFAFLPATFPRDDKGGGVITSGWAQERLGIVDYGRPSKHNRRDFCQPTEEPFLFKYDFGETEAKMYVEFLTKSYKNTEDEDGSIVAIKYDPSFSDRMKFFGPIIFFALVACVIIALIFHRT